MTEAARPALDKAEVGLTKSLGKTIKMLRGAHDFLQQEMECLARPAPITSEALGRFRDMAWSFREQAHSLLATMAYQAASEPLQEEVEDLVRVFSEAISQIEARLAEVSR